MFHFCFIFIENLVLLCKSCIHCAFFYFFSFCYMYMWAVCKFCFQIFCFLLVCCTSPLCNAVLKAFFLFFIKIENHWQMLNDTSLSWDKYTALIFIFTACLFILVKPSHRMRQYKLQPFHVMTFCHRSPVDSIILL